MGCIHTWYPWCSLNSHGASQGAPHDAKLSWHSQHLAKVFCCFILFYHSRELELEHGADLTASYVNTSVDLKFFPDSPVERDVANRVRWPVNTTASHRVPPESPERSVCDLNKKVPYWWHPSAKNSDITSDWLLFSTSCMISIIVLFEFKMVSSRPRINCWCF